VPHRAGKLRAAFRSASISRLRSARFALATLKQPRRPASECSPSSQGEAEQRNQDPGFDLRVIPRLQHPTSACSSERSSGRPFGSMSPSSSCPPGLEPFTARLGFQLRVGASRVQLTAAIFERAHDFSPGCEATGSTASSTRAGRQALGGMGIPNQRRFRVGFRWRPDIGTPPVPEGCRSGLPGCRGRCRS
jgi:hypothetical protein